MSDYREESIRRKAVQRGIIDQRPVSSNKKAAPGNWLFVHDKYSENKWVVFRDYKTEADARKQMEKYHFYRGYVVERHIFDAHYRHQKWSAQ